MKIKRILTLLIAVLCIGTVSVNAQKIKIKINVENNTDDDYHVYGMLVDDAVIPVQYTNYSFIVAANSTHQEGFTVSPDTKRYDAKIEWDDPTPPAPYAGFLGDDPGAYDVYSPTNSPSYIHECTQDVPTYTGSDIYYWYVIQ